MKPDADKSQQGVPGEPEGDRRYRLVAELTSDFAYSYELDKQGKPLPGWIAGAFASITGYTPDGMRLAGGWEKLVHPDDLEGALHQSSELAAGRPCTVEYRIRDRSGILHWLRDFAAPVTEGSRVVRVVGAVKDITEQKKANEAYRQLVENSLQGRLILGREGIVFANPMASEVTGWPHDELVGMKMEDWLALVHPEDRSLVLERFRMRMKGKEAPQRYEVRFIDRDGRTRWMEILSASIEYLGRPAVQVALMDSTERRLIENHLQALMQSVPGAVIYQTGGGVEFISDNVEAVLGYPAADFTTDRTFFPGLIHPDDRAVVDGEYRAWAQGGYPGVHVKEFRVRHRDGRWLWLRDQTRLAFRTADGKHSAIGVLVDITEEKRAEGELRAERDRAQKYLDLANVVFVVLDRDGRVAVLNRRGSEVLEWPEEELVGRDWFETCIPDAERASVRATFDALMRGELEPVEYHENAVLTRGGQRRVIAWHNTVLTDDAGRPTGTVSSGQLAGDSD